MTGCRRPPRGWRCTRPGPHTGPCPTVPAWWNLWGAWWGRTKAIR
jgi:hypothetical protein